MNKAIKQSGKINLQSIVLILLLTAGVGIIALLQIKKTAPIQTAQPILSKGVPAPDFTLPDLEGAMIRLSDYRGKIVLLNIWATWCPPCVEEMPDMEKLHQTLKDEGLVILAVSIDKNGPEVVADFMKKNRLSFTSLIDSRGSVSDLYRTTGVPESFIIDKNGKLVEIIIGPRAWSSPEAIQYFRSLIRG